MSLDDETITIIKNLPKKLSPMSKLSIGITLLQQKSLFKNQ